jgi:hypothetical protein
MIQFELNSNDNVGKLKKIIGEMLKIQESRLMITDMGFS